MENKAKIHILGAAAVLVSTVKLEDWKLVEQFAPEVLKIFNENGEPTFRIMTGACTGSVNHYGITWGCEAYVTEDGCATVTILLDDEIEDRKAAVMNVAGSALMNLIGIESTLPEIIQRIREKTQQAEVCVSQL